MSWNAGDKNTPSMQHPRPMVGLKKLKTTSSSSTDQMISPHAFPVRGRHWAPLTLLSQARIFRRYVTGRFTPSWEAATTCQFHWKWHWQSRPPLRRRNPTGTTKRQTCPSSKTWLTCCAENLTLTTVRTSTPVSSSWRTAYFKQQSRPSPEAEERTTSLTGATTYVPPWPTCRSQKTTWAASFARAHHPLQQGKGCFWRRKEQGSPQVTARKDWLTQHGERHTEALESDKGPEWWPAACSKSSPFEGSTQIFTGKKAAYLLADSFREDSLLDISREKQADTRMKTKEQLQKQSPTPSMTSEFSIHELNCAIRQLKNKKAPWKDGISNEMIRHLGSLAKQKLLDIYNHSWNTGTFLTSWKEAIIIPIPNKGKDRHSKTSYHPISLLQSMEEGSSLQAPKEESLRQHLLMDPELLVLEISTSQAWWTNQLFSKSQRSPTRWSHLTHSLHYFYWWHCDHLSSHIPRALHADDLTLWTKAEQVTTAAIRIQEAMNLISD